MCLDQKRALRAGVGSVSMVLFSLLAACGGGAGTPMSSGMSAQAPLSTGVTVLGMDGSGIPAEAATLQLAPAYHLAAVLPPVPTQADRSGLSLSASEPPAISVIPEEARNMATRALTYEQLLAPAASTGAAPATASTGVTVTYSPAQVRAAYGLPPVPSSLAGMTALQAAQLGAGSTIYVVDAFHDPFALSELLSHSELFGLPGCTGKTLAATATLPLAAPSVNACDFYQVSSTKTGTVGTSAPSYDPNWATEIALDVQWAHAIAPLARIVLIEAPDATLPSLTGAIQLANRMGPGAVSMSFTGAEGSFVTSMDTYFQTGGMSYFAATGDNGAAVGWPAVSPFVVAVGGTSLSYSGSGSRTEVVWSGTGGGVSAYEPQPAYQSGVVPGPGTPGHRAVADVAFNADPNHGQYVAVIPNQLTCSFCQVSWVTAGGTSLATPQWAGIAAVVNALRAQAGKGPIGDPHALLYGQVADIASNYSADVVDITTGSDGSCATCSARKGYDLPTGIGTPNGLALINSLAGAAIAPVAPAVAGATINGSYDQGLSFTASISDANPCTYSLTGAPGGMTISNSAVVTWNPPVPGTYAVTVVAKDSKTGLTGQGVYKVVIAPPPPPFVSSGSISGTAGQALSFNVAVGTVNPYKLSLSGAPAGLSISSTGVVTWAKPVAGSYRIVVTALDGTTKLSGQGVYTVAVSAPLAPVVNSGSISAKPGSALTFNVPVAGANPYVLSLTGAPAGMTIGKDGTVNWATPLAGTFTVTINAQDSKTGLIGEGIYSLLIGTSTGPAVTASQMSGVAGKPFSGTISISDGGASLIGDAFFGAPQGVSFGPQGGGFNNIAVKWAAPVAGNYTVQVQANDANGLMTQVTIPLTITSR